MKVTALDLRSAYKQLPLNEADTNKAVVTILNPDYRDTLSFSS